MTKGVKTAAKNKSDVFDAAQYILQLCKHRKMLPITTWKLQKLVYYSQAWALVWDDTPIFDNKIEAWANGPVCPDLYQIHKGRFKISALDKGRADIIDPRHKETMDIVFGHYGPKTSQYLSELTHLEEPWKSAREGIPNGQRSSNEISQESMAEYYGGL